MCSKKVLSREEAFEKAEKTFQTAMLEDAIREAVLAMFVEVMKESLNIRQEIDNCYLLFQLEELGCLPEVEQKVQFIYNGVYLLFKDVCVWKRYGYDLDSIIIEVQKLNREISQNSATLVIPDIDLFYRFKMYVKSVVNQNRELQKILLNLKNDKEESGGY